MNILQDRDFTVAAAADTSVLLLTGGRAPVPVALVHPNPYDSVGPDDDEMVHFVHGEYGEVTRVSRSHGLHKKIPLFSLVLFTPSAEDTPSSVLRTLLSVCEVFDAEATARVSLALCFLNRSPHTRALLHTTHPNSSPPFVVLFDGAIGQEALHPSSPAHVYEKKIRSHLG
jgi:hypothetical protein